jgi:integrase
LRQQVPLDTVERHEAIRWAETMPAGVVADTIVLFNRAVDEELLERNPFRGLGRRSPGRADTDPPTEAQMVSLLEACSAVGADYAPRIRALVTFAAYTIMRPGELFALDWEHVDLEAGVVHVVRRVYKGEYDLPKSNRVRTVAQPYGDS